jgi:hypothetical protein
MYAYNFKEKATSSAGISIVVPCDGARYDMFKTTYATYMAYGFPDNLSYEFLLVSRTITDIDLPNVRVINYTHDGEFFNPAKALNLGVVNSKFDTIFITCPEVKPVTNIIEQYLSSPIGNYICRAYDQSVSGMIEDLVRTGLKDHIPSMYFLGIFKKQDILAINGWDEDFMKGFSWEDVDFGERFSRANLTHTVRDDMKVLHMYHARNYINNGWEINWNVIQENIKNNVVQCKNGINKL